MFFYHEGIDMKKLFIALLGAICLIFGSVAVSTNVVHNTAQAQDNCK
jgi:hypothetical protein